MRPHVDISKKAAASRDTSQAQGCSGLGSVNTGSFCSGCLSNCHWEVASLFAYPQQNGRSFNTTDLQSLHPPYCGRNSCLKYCWVQLTSLFGHRLYFKIFQSPHLADMASCSTASFIFLPTSQSFLQMLLCLGKTKLLRCTVGAQKMCLANVKEHPVWMICSGRGKPCGESDLENQVWRVDQLIVLGVSVLLFASFLSFFIFLPQLWDWLENTSTFYF